MKGPILGKRYSTKNMYFFLSLQRLSETFFILKINERDKVKNVY
jgi:hypothetical protein